MVKRVDLNKCIGCKNCYTVCPMDVFRFDEEKRKSVIAYPESCQNCGQCVINCLGTAITLTDEIFAYPIVGSR